MERTTKLTFCSRVNRVRVYCLGSGQRAQKENGDSDEVHDGGASKNVSTVFEFGIAVESGVDGGLEIRLMKRKEGA